MSEEFNLDATRHNDELEDLDEVRRQKLYFQISTELLEQVTWRIDLETMTVLDVSPSIKQVRGYEQEDIIGQPVEKMVTPASYRHILEKLPDRIDKLANADSDGFQLFEVVEQPHQNGGTVWTELAVCYFRRADGGAEAVGVSRSLGHQKVLADICRQLADSERFLQVLWDAAPCMLSCVDCEGRFLRINQRFADNRRIARDSAVGCYFGDILPDEPHIRAKHKQLFAECLTGRTVEFIDQYRPDDEDSDRWSYGKYKPVLSADGQVKKVISAIMDVTELQEMKRQLTEAEKIGHTGSWYLHLGTGRFSCSDGLLDLYGVSREEFAAVGRQIFWSRLQPEACEQLARWEDIKWLAEQEELECENELILPDKSRRLVRVNGNVRKDDKGKPVEVYGTVTDITERRVLEEAAKNALLRLREFSQTMPGAGMIVDEAGTVIEVFDDNGLLSGNTAEVWPGRNLAQILPAEPASQLLHVIGYAIVQKRLQFGEYTLELSRGRRTFDVRIAPLSYRQEGQATAACYWTDVTDQRHTKELLELTYEKRRQRDLLNDLADGKLLPSQEVLDQAWQVKLNLSQGFSCYVLEIEAETNKEVDLWQQRREQLQTLADGLAAELAGEQGVIIWESRDGIALLVPVKPGAEMDKEQELAQAQRWQQLICRQWPAVRYYIGIAEYHSDTFWQFPKVYEQARTAVELGKKLAPDRIVHHYLDIGVFQFFPAVLNLRYVKDFMQRTLGKLAEYDRLQGTSLVDTLEKILQTDNLTIVAKQLYVHRQTVLFRKKRIETVLQVSLDDFETRLALGMALKFRRVYGDQG